LFHVVLRLKGEQKKKKKTIIRDKGEETKYKERKRRIKK
jgi:hypothetical protein